MTDKTSAAIEPELPLLPPADAFIQHGEGQCYFPSTARAHGRACYEAGQRAAIAAHVAKPAGEVAGLVEMAKEALNAAYRHGRAHLTVREGHSQSFAEARRDELLETLASMAPTQGEAQGEVAHVLRVLTASPLPDQATSNLCDTASAIYWRNVGDAPKDPYGSFRSGFCAAMALAKADATPPAPASPAEPSEPPHDMMGASS